MMNTSLDIKKTAGPVATAALLVQAKVTRQGVDTLVPQLRALIAVIYPDATLQAAWSETAQRVYAYLHLAGKPLLDSAAALKLEQALGASSDGVSAVQVSRLENVFDIAGASAGQTPAFHYVVEMDPETGWAPELASWYDTEHMPGLAGVDGCIRATRLLNHDHGPLSLACYDLVTQEALGSPPWLAVRASDWSSRVRPHFTNTVRTMFEVMPCAWDMRG